MMEKTTPTNYFGLQAPEKSLNGRPVESQVNTSELFNF